MSESTERVSALIESRLEEIREEVARLERASKALAPDGRVGVPRRGRTAAAAAGANGAATRGPRSSRRPRGRAAPGKRGEELLTAIRSWPGASVADLAEKIAIPKTQVHPLIARARAERLIVKDGDGYRLKGS